MRINALRGLAASALLLWTIAAAHAGEKIAWSKSFSTALAQAKQTHRLIAVDFYADW